MSDDTGQQTSLDEIVTDHAKKESGDESKFRTTPTGRYVTDWEIIRGGDHFSLRNGDFLDSEKRDEDETVPVYGGNGIMGYTSDSNTDPGTVVIGRVGAYCGNVHLTESEAWVTDNSILLNELSEYNEMYLNYLLSSLKLGQFSEQSAQPRISQSTVENLRIPHPPLQEQRKIASVLYNVDEAIQKIEEIIEQTKRIKKGVVQTVFRRGVRDHSSFIKTGSGEYPDQWDLVKFENLIEDTRYGTDNKSNTNGEGYPTLRIPNVVEKRITTEDLKHTPLDEDELERLRLEDDDLLVVRTNGNPNYVGRCATFSERDKPFVFASYLIRIRVDESYVRPAYVREFLNSQRGRSEMSGWVRSSAGNYNLSVGAIKKFDVPVPSLEEQDEIIEKIDHVEETIRVNDQQYERLKRLKQGLIQDLLSGKIRTTNRNISVLPEVKNNG